MVARISQQPLQTYTIEEFHKFSHLQILSWGSQLIIQSISMVWDEIEMQTGNCMTLWDSTGKPKIKMVEANTISTIIKDMSKIHSINPPVL